MFNKDTIRLIKKTHKRFLTLFLMVLIGVAFMVGLMSTAPTMQRSVDDYYDEYNYMDVQLYSSYGFCDEDLKALEKNKSIDTVFGSKFVDVYAHDQKENTFVTRLEEINSPINKFKLNKGRMPLKANEVLAMDSGKVGKFFDIGDKIKVDLKDKDINDYVSITEFEVVGLVSSPRYMANTSETSTLDNLDLHTVLFIDNDLLLSEYYTSVYLDFNDTDDKLAFSDKYNETIKKDMISLNHTIDTQSNYLKAEILDKANQKIEDGQKELEEKSLEGQKKLEEAKAKLDDAKVTIAIGEFQIESTKTQLSVAENEIKMNEAIIKSSEAEIEKAKKLICEKTGLGFDESVKLVEELYNTYQSISSQKDNVDAQNKKLNEIIKANEDKILDLEKELENTNDENKKAELLVEISKLKSQNEVMKLAIENNNEESYQAILDELDKQAGGSVIKTYADVKALKDGISKLEYGKNELISAKKQLEVGKSGLDVLIDKIASGKYEYNKGLEELAKAEYTLNDEVYKAQKELDKARQDLLELPEAKWMVLDRNSQYSSALFDGTIKQMTNIGNIFPLLFFLVAALVCMTTMKRLVDEQRSQIGIFSALGFSRKQIIMKYVTYAFIASILGSIFGIAIGLPIFPVVIYSVWNLMYQMPEMHLTLLFKIAAIGVIAFTSLMVIVTSIVAYQTLNDVPASLLRPKPPRNAKKVFLEYIKPIWNNLSFTSKITARNIIRYKSRFFMTVIGIGGCMSLLVLGFGIKDAIGDIIRIQYGEVFKYNYTVNLESDYYTKDVKDLLLDDATNKQVQPFMSYSSKVYLEDEDKTINVQVFDDRQIDRVIDLRQRNDHEALDITNGVIVSEKFAKTNNLKVGDEIKLESKEGIKSSFIVGGICEMYFQNYLFMSSSDYEDSFDEIVKNDKIAVLNVDGDINSLLENTEGVDSIVDFSAMINRFETMIRALDFIILVIILAAGSLSFVVLINLTEVNISERLREIATLKVLGFRVKEVNSYIFKEIFLLTILGAIIGMPLGKLEQSYVMSVIDMEMVMFGNNIKPLSYIYSFLITITFSIIVMLVMRKNLAKIEMVESLKSVE